MILHQNRLAQSSGNRKLKLIIFIIVLFNLVSCSTLNVGNSCVVTKNSLVMGKTSVNVKGHNLDLWDYCRGISGCKKMNLTLNPDQSITLWEEVEKNQIENMKFEIGKVEDLKFINTTDPLPDTYKRYQNYVLDPSALIVKQVLDTNILFYNRNELNFYYSESCSPAEAYFGAIGVGILENSTK
jgi:hypothetical protein